MVHAGGAAPETHTALPPAALEPSAYCRLGGGDASPAALHATFAAPARAVTPQQARMKP